MDPVRRALLLALLASAVAGTGWVFFRGSEEDHIKEQLERLPAAVRFSEGTNALIYLARIKDAYTAVLTDDVHVSVPELPGGVRGRPETATTTASLVQRFRTADVELRDIEIKLDDAKITAQVTATGVLVGGEHGGGAQRDQRVLTFHMRKVDGTWRVASLTIWAREP